MKRRNFLGAGGLLLVGLAAVGCGSAVPGTPGGPNRPATPTSGGVVPSSSGGVVTSGAPATGTEVRAQAARMAAADTAAARGRFSELSARLFTKALPGTDNALLSPYSIIAALGMTEVGARAGTAAALQTLLGGDAAAVAGLLTATDTALAQAVKDGTTNASGVAVQTAVDAANSLYAQRGLAVQQQFLDALASGYGAGLRLEDFINDPQGARTEINAWVAQRTHDLIPTLLPAGVITDLTRIVLVNALYLKASWDNPFDPQQDEPATFTTAAGAAVKTTLMSNHFTAPYAKGPGWQSVSVPYAGGGLAMTIVLPDKGKFAAVAAGLTGPMLTIALDGSDEDIDLSMPAFAGTTAVDLAAPLTALGAGPLFTDACDLSGIAGQPGDLLVSQVVHQAKISVDHHGTEAAAATAVVMMAGSAPQPNPKPPIDFTVNRAFFYVIHDTTTLMPLFVGRVSDPTV